MQWTFALAGGLVCLGLACFKPLTVRWVFFRTVVSGFKSAFGDVWEGVKGLGVSWPACFKNASGIGF